MLSQSCRRCSAATRGWLVAKLVEGWLLAVGLKILHCRLFFKVQPDWSVSFKAVRGWRAGCKTRSYFAIVHNSRADSFSRTGGHLLMKIQARNNAKGFSLLPTVFGTSSFELQTDNVGNILSHVNQTLSVMMLPKTCFLKLRVCSLAFGEKR